MSSDILVANIIGWIVISLGHAELLPGLGFTLVAIWLLVPPIMAVPKAHRANEARLRAIKRLSDEGPTVEAR